MLVTPVLLLSIHTESAGTFNEQIQRLMRYTAKSHIRQTAVTGRQYQVRQIVGRKLGHIASFLTTALECVTNLSSSSNVQSVSTRKAMQKGGLGRASTYS